MTIHRPARNWRPIFRRAAMAGLAVATTAGLLLPALAKTPGHTYCFYGRCHRVKTITEMQSLVGTETIMAASHYDSCARDRYNPCGLTSSGEAFAPDRPDNAASPIYPDGTIVLVWSPATEEAAVLRINNAGPYWGNRTLDVSFATAERLGFRKQGVANLAVRVLSAPTKEEASYVRQRRYDRVLGHIGTFASPDEALQTVAALSAADALASSVFAPSAGQVVVAARLAVLPDFAIAQSNYPATSKRAATQLAALDLDTLRSRDHRRPRRAFGDAPHVVPKEPAAGTVVASLSVPPQPPRAAARIMAPRLEPLSRSVANPLSTVASISSRKASKPAGNFKTVPRQTKFAALQTGRTAKKAASFDRPAATLKAKMTPATPPAVAVPARKLATDHMVQGFQPHASDFKKEKTAAAKTAVKLKPPSSAVVPKGGKPQGGVKIVKKQASGAQKSATLRPGVAKPPA